MFWRKKIKNTTRKWNWVRVWVLDYHGWCWEWDPKKRRRPCWRARVKEWKKKMEAWRWNNRGNRRAWRSAISNWEWSWPRAPFAGLFSGRTQNPGRILGGPEAVGPGAPPFSPPKTSTPPIAAETATHLVAEKEKRTKTSKADTFRFSHGNPHIFSENLKPFLENYHTRRECDERKRSK